MIMKNPCNCCKRKEKRWGCGEICEVRETYDRLLQEEEEEIWRWINTPMTFGKKEQNEN